MTVTSPPPPSRADVLRGLAWNRSAPHSVFARLLAVDPLPGDGDFLSKGAWGLTPAQVDAVVACPNPAVRRLVVDSDHIEDPAIRLRFLDDPDATIRFRALREASGWVDPWGKALVSEAVLSRLVRDPDPRVRRSLLLHGNLPETDLLALTADADDKVRTAAVGELLRRRQAAARDDAVPRARMDHDPFDYEYRSNSHARLSDDPDLAPELLAELAESDDDRIRIAISLRPELTDAERLAIRDTVHPYRHTIPRWIRAAYGSPDTLRRIASSAHPLMRRSAATAPRLPADVVAALASDEDLFVRLTLAQHCDDAPAELVLDMYANWNGARWDDLRFRPTYPWHDIERLVSHPSRRVRWTATMSDYLTPDLAVRLIADEYAEVRAGALRSRHLPVEVLMKLLPQHPRHAAANPNLPWHVMHQLLDDLGIPAFEPPSFPADGSRLGD
ncbi:hypothetical protein ACPA54_18730 [Uniformispora flossi]|uniref:hypothetical protein n=1 Tax=Uniformispora flossi TaxID=3390723 RepID=UPI003C2C2634